MASKKNFKDLNYHLTDEDTIAFNRFYIKTTKMGHRAVTEQKIIFPALIIIAWLMEYIFKASRTFMLITLGGMAIGAIYVWINAERILLKQQEKKIRQAAYSLDSLHGSPVVLEFRDDEIYTFYEDNEVVIGYGDVHKVSKTNEALYLWMNETTALPIPQSAFTVPGLMDMLYSYLQEKCPDSEFEEFDM